MSVYDPETLDIMHHALNEAWALLPQRSKNKFVKIDMAERVLRRAAAGERDLARLRAAALVGTGIEEAVTPWA